MQSTITDITYLLFMACEFDCLVLDHSHDPEPHFPEWDALTDEHLRVAAHLSDADFNTFVELLDAM